MGDWWIDEAPWPGPVERGNFFEEAARVATEYGIYTAAVIHSATALYIECDEEYWRKIFARLDSTVYPVWKEPDPTQRRRHGVRINHPRARRRC